MENLNSKYPFLSSAKTSVEESGFNLMSIIEKDTVTVERALDRILHAIEEGYIGPEHKNPEVELLSYPISRVLISLVNDPGLTHRYAWAESQTAISRFEQDLEIDNELKSITVSILSLQKLLSELNITKEITKKQDKFYISIDKYLSFIPYLPGPSWRLVFKELSEGKVPITLSELYKLLGVGIFQRIKIDLPLKIPREATNLLQLQLKTIQDYIEEIDIELELETIPPNLFPPCILSLLNRIDSNEKLDQPSLFSLFSFLISVNSSHATIRNYFSNNELDPLSIESLFNQLQDANGKPVYPLPSCNTMQSYGLCVNMDETCKNIAHPLQYHSVKQIMPD